MKTTTATALALLLGLGLALPAAAQQQQPAQQPTEPAAEVQDEQPAAATGAAQAQQPGGQMQQAAPAGAGQEMEAEATVATVDQTSLMMTTEEGDEYTLAEGNLVQGLMPGTKVRITYTEQDGQKTVTHIEPVQP